MTRVLVGLLLLAAVHFGIRAFYNGAVLFDFIQPEYNAACGGALLLDVFLHFRLNHYVLAIMPEFGAGWFQLGIQTGDDGTGFIFLGQFLTIGFKSKGIIAGHTG